VGQPNAPEVGMGKWGLALVAALLGAACWWLLRDDAPTSAAEPDALTPRAADVAPAAALPRPASADVSPAALAAPADTAPLAPDADAAPAATWRDTLDVLRATGRVVDVDGRPVSGAQLLLLPDARTQRALDLELEHEVELEILLGLRAEALESVVTDAQGGFVLEGPWERQDAPRFAGFAYNFPTLLVRADGWAVHGFALDGYAGGAVDVGDLTLEHLGGSLRARFVDEQGAPVPGALVDVGFAWFGVESPSAAPPQGAPFFRVDSDADGTWAITHQWAGAYTLRVLSAEFEERTLEAELGAGEDLDLGDVTLVRAAHVAGIVRDPRGAPVAGARVTAADAGFGTALPDVDASDADFLITTFPFQAREGVVSGDDGRFTLPGLPRAAAPYRVIAAAVGFESAWIGDVAPDSEGLELVLRDEARVEVSAFDESTGADIDDFELLAFRDINRWMPLTKPHMKQYLPLPTSGHVVHQAGPVGTRLFLMAPGSTQELRDVPGLQPGEVHHERVGLRPAHTLRIRCVDDLGAPVPDARVWLTPPAAWGSGLRHGPHRSLADERTDTDGVVVFEGLGVGTWGLHASADAHEQHVDPALAVTEDDAEHEVVLMRSGGLLGRVFAADGTPAAAQRVMWHDGTRLAADQLTDAEGRFRFDHVTGRGTLHAVLAPVLELELARGETREVELWQRAPAVVEGRVLDAMGVPIPDVLVQLVGPEPLGRAFTLGNHVTLVDGRFRFESELPGVYELFALHEGANVSRVVELALGTRVEAELTFGSATLAGVVVTGDTGLDPAQLTVTLDAGADILARVRPQADGSFAFTQLAPGSYHLGTYGGMSLAERWGPFFAEAHETLDGIELHPRRAARLHGRAIHQDGGPFQGFVHLRCADGEHYEIAWIKWGDGMFDQRGLHAGAWRIDLAEQGSKVLGAGVDGTEGLGEPGVELPFYAREDVVLAPGENRELTLVVPDSARR